MKKVISYVCLAGLCVFLFSCESESKSQEVDIIEKAIESSDTEARYGSTPDVLNKIYEELLKKDTTLAKLDGTIDLLIYEKDRLEKPFKSYDEKNTVYYDNANALLNSFSDSVLKQKYAAIIQKSLENYHNKTKDLRDVINEHDLKTKKI
ncbi:MAG TPA: hypothetical protein VGE24_07200, partial [Emticicia sp.]